MRAYSQGAQKSTTLQKVYRGLILDEGGYGAFMKKPLIDRLRTRLRASVLAGDEWYYYKTSSSVTRIEYKAGKAKMASAEGDVERLGTIPLEDLSLADLKECAYRASAGGKAEALKFLMRFASQKGSRMLEKEIYAGALEGLVPCQSMECLDAILGSKPDFVKFHALAMKSTNIVMSAGIFGAIGQIYVRAYVDSELCKKGEPDYYGITLTDSKEIRGVLEKHNIEVGKMPHDAPVMSPVGKSG